MRRRASSHARRGTCAYPPRRRKRRPQAQGWKTLLPPGCGLNHIRLVVKWCKVYKSHQCISIVHFSIEIWFVAGKQPQSVGCSSKIAILNSKTHPPNPQHLRSFHGISKCHHTSQFTSWHPHFFAVSIPPKEPCKIHMSQLEMSQELEAKIPSFHLQFFFV